MLIIDDEIEVNREDICDAFAVWSEVKSIRKELGTFPRCAEMDPPYYNIGNDMDVHCDNGRNILLTKFLFVHKMHLFAYNCMVPHEFWLIPHESVNCEDIILNIVVTYLEGRSTVGTLFYPQIHD